MRLTVIGLVALGLFAAICAAVLVAALRAQQPADSSGDGTVVMAEVVVAIEDLPAMAVINASSVEVRSIPADEVPRGALRSATAAIGKVLVAPLKEGQPFTQSSFARDGSGVHLASVLKPGYRAMSVALQDFSGLDGLLYPGSIVDVIASFRVAQQGDDGSIRGGDLVSTVLLEAIQVLAIEDQTIVSGARNKELGEAEGTRVNRSRRVVTLLVDPRQAEALQLASGHGTIALTLRNPLDQYAVDRRGTSFLDLSPTFGHRMISIQGDEGFASAELVEPLPEPEPEPLPEPPATEVADAEEAPPSWQTVIIRGPSTATQSFEVPEGVEPNTRPDARPNPASGPPADESAPPSRR